jgi:dihydroorotate dehydrogenase
MNTSVKIGKLTLKNPVTVASGTAGYGEELARFFDISRLGAIFTKGLSLEPRRGNKGNRVLETPSGMLNSIGLENVGLKIFIDEKLPFLIGKKRRLFRTSPDILSTRTLSYAGSFLRRRGYRPLRSMCHVPT